VQLPPIGVTRPMPPLPATPTPVVAATTAPLTDTLPRRTERPPARRRMVPMLIAVVVLALLGGLAFALFGGGPPPGGVATTRSPSPTSASPSASSSPSSSATPPPADPVQDAVAALRSLVTAGLQDGTISQHAADEIQRKLDEALEKYSEGDTEKAIEELEHLRNDLDHMVDHDEIENPEAQHLDKAIRDLEEQMLLASPPEDD